MTRVSIFCSFLVMGLAGVAGCGEPRAGAADDAAAAQAAPAEGGDGESATRVAVAENAPGPALYDEILGAYVAGGYFDYAGLLANEEDLAKFEAFLAWQAAADVAEMSREDQIAFYINAYNACCIKAVLDHYPVHTPLDIEGFFDGLTFTVGGEELTISQIEYERLIANYEDMRAHFAVVCADRGCLPLSPAAYTGETLDADLEAAAQRFVADENQFAVDPENRVVQISKIFEWYGEKFLADPERPVESGKPEQYLLPWVDEPTRELLESGDYELEIIEWSWTLNEKAGG